MADRDNRLNGASRLSLPINRNDKLGKTDLDDLFRFSLSARSSLSLGVSNIKRGANFDVELYSLTPNTAIPGSVGKTEFRKLKAGVRNRYLTLAGASRKSGNNNEAISLGDVAAGDYVIRVLRKQGDSKYKLAATATEIIDPGTNPNPDPGTIPNPDPGTIPTPPDPRNSIATAPDTSISTPITGTVSDADNQDYYKVTTTAAGDYLFDLSGTGGDANLEIIGSDTTTVLKRGVNAGNDKFILPLAGGTYYFRVLQAAPGNTIGYTLGVSQLTDKFAGKYDSATTVQASATPLTLTPVSNYVVDKGFNSPEDLFTFSVTTPQAFATLNLSNMPIGDLGIQIFKEGETPEQGLTRDLSRNQDGSYPDEVLGGRVTQGKYYVRVIPSSTVAGEGSTYTLALKLSDKSGQPAISRDIKFGPDGSTPRNITKVDQFIYFSASDESGTALWRSDGTLDGTKKIRSFSSLNKFVTVGTGASARLYFAANDGSTGEEVWTTDGNTATKVIDLYEGGVGGNNSGLPRLLTAVGNTLYFVGNPSPQDTALYRVNGNTVTVVARSNTTITNPDGSANTAPVINSIANLTGVGDTLYFAGATSVLSDPTNPNSQLRATGVELFSISNTAATPTLTELKSGTSNSSPSNFIQVGNKLFMTAVVEGTNRVQLIRLESLGSTPTYTVIRSSGSDNLSFDANQKLEYTVTSNGSLYFAANGEIEGNEIFKLDNAATTVGTPQSASVSILDTGAPVSDIVPGVGNSTPTNLVSIGNNVFFFATNNFQDANGNTLGNGRELWSTNGTTTSIVKDIQGGTGSSIGTQAEMVVYQGKLYFTANDGVEGTELWESDGTNANTKAIVINAVAGAGANPTGLTPIDNTSLFFAATDGLNGEELWSI